MFIAHTETLLGFVSRQGDFKFVRSMATRRFQFPDGGSLLLVVASIVWQLMAVSVVHAQVMLLNCAIIALSLLTARQHK